MSEYLYEILNNINNSFTSIFILSNFLKAVLKWNNEFISFECKLKTCWKVEQFFVFVNINFYFTYF